MYKFLTIIFLSGLILCDAKNQKFNIHFYESNISCIKKINSTNFTFKFREHCKLEDDCISKIIRRHDFKNTVLNYSNNSIRLIDLGFTSLHSRCINISKYFYSYDIKINHSDTFFIAASFTVGLCLFVIVVFIVTFIYYAAEYTPVKIKRGFKYTTFSATNP